MHTTNRMLLGSALFAVAACTLAGATSPVHAAATTSQTAPAAEPAPYSYAAPSLASLASATSAKEANAHVTCLMVVCSDNPYMRSFFGGAAESVHLDIHSLD